MELSSYQPDQGRRCWICNLGPPWEEDSQSRNASSCICSTRNPAWRCWRSGAYDSRIATRRFAVRVLLVSCLFSLYEKGLLDLWILIHLHLVLISVRLDTSQGMHCQSLDGQWYWIGSLYSTVSSRLLRHVIASWMLWKAPYFQFCFLHLGFNQ